jgi:hypothetical protein
MLHFIPDADAPGQIINTQMGATTAGSYLVISHGTHHAPPDKAEEVAQIYRRTSTPLSLRTRDEITALFVGLELLPPGVVSVTHWRPDPGEEPEDLPLLAGVARTR